jgi:hypothetical protein
VVDVVSGVNTEEVGSSLALTMAVLAVAVALKSADMTVGILWAIDEEEEKREEAEEEAAEEATEEAAEEEAIVDDVDRMTVEKPEGERLIDDSAAEETGASETGGADWAFTMRVGVATRLAVE